MSWRLIADRVRKLVVPLMQWLNRLWHVLWACRVSFASMAIGVLLLSLVPQAQDVFLDKNTPAFWLSAFALFLLAWAAPVHYSARLVLQDPHWLFPRDFVDPSSTEYDRRRKEYERDYGNLVTWVPRILGILCFVGIYIALYKVEDNLPGSKSLTGGPFADEVMSARENLTALCYYTTATLLLFVFYTILRRPIFSMIKKRRIQRLDWHPPFLPKGYRTISGLIFMYSLFALFLIVVILADFSEDFQRARFFALMLGAWIPILTFLSIRSHKYRIPFILLFAFVIAALIAFLSDNHDLRVVRSKPIQISLVEAVSAWRKSNNCSEDSGTECPRPIIVAASGGASRAGFFTASALGHLIDATCDTASNAKVCTRPSVFAKRLFAISAVSGSSVGAVFLSAALADSKDGRPGCNADEDGLWFGANVPVSWKECLQALLAGDFLSPMLVGLAVRDVFGFFEFPDRAKLLERSWEERYESLIPAAGQMKGSANDEGSVSERKGLDRPFSFFRPTDDGPESWRPLLVLNGTSVQTGRRILTSHLEPEFDLNAPCERHDKDSTVCRIFPDSYDLYSIFHNDAKSEMRLWERAWQNVRHYIRERRNWFPYNYCPRSRKGQCDVSLATAAHNSARFPLVSPPGNIRNASDDIIDRIVDGGYFENFGIITAVQLARNVERLLCGPSPVTASTSAAPEQASSELQAPRGRSSETGSCESAPFILLITNEPTLPFNTTDERVRKTSCFTSRAAARQVPSCPNAVDAQFLTWLIGPVGGLYQTRTARGSLARTRLTAEFGDRMAEIRVYPNMNRELPREDLKDVSMSWWLSKPVQAHLDRQLHNHQNGLAFERTCAALGTKHDTRAADACRTYIQREASEFAGQSRARN